ncbi:MAG: hypothetical protein MJ188_07450, partial [Treponema sp.]|nr:hypothetical protein [Treponema sp.]
MKNNKNQNKYTAKRKSVSLKQILLVLVILFVFAFTGFSVTYIVKKSLNNKITIKTIKEKWNAYDYSGLYEVGKSYLQEHPFNNTALLPAHKLPIQW